MKFARTISQNRTAQVLSRAVPVVALLACASALPKSTEAATFDIFLIAEQSAPVSTGTAPLSVTTQKVYQLGGLNNNNKATTQTLVNNFTFDIDTSLSFLSLNDPSSGPSSGAPDENWLTDQGENQAPNGDHVPPSASYLNSEISIWENSGISGTTVDAGEQLDFGRNSSVTFNSVLGGFTDLILSDLGGLNPFDLSLCSNILCTTTTQLFAGLSGGLTTALIGLSDFAATDNANDGGQDQTWLFRFDSPITDFVRVLESDNRNIFTGARLQADFIGAKSASAPSPVPGPASLPLLASGFVLLGWTLRRKKR